MNITITDSIKTNCPQCNKTWDYPHEDLYYELDRYAIRTAYCCNRHIAMSVGTTTEEVVVGSSAASCIADLVGRLKAGDVFHSSSTRARALLAEKRRDAEGPNY